jgi:hypothetical protein
MKPPDVTTLDAAVAVVVVTSTTPQDLLPAEQKLDSLDEFNKQCFDESMGWTFKVDDAQVGTLFKQRTNAIAVFKAKMREMNREETLTHPLLKLFLDGKCSRKAGWLRKGCDDKLSDEDTYRILLLLAQLMFANIDTHGLHLDNVIGHTFNVAERTINKLKNKKSVATKLFQSSKQLQSTQTKLMISPL